MPDRNRLYQLALGGWLLTAILCGGALAQNTEQPTISPQAAKTDSGQSEDAKELLTTLKGIEAAIRAQAITEDIDVSKRRELREDSNLAAQQEMAKHTRGVNYAAWVGIVLSAIAVALLAKTMGYTAEAAKYAKIAAEAAVKTVDEARNTNMIAHEANETTRLALLNDKRAWLSIEKFSLIGPTYYHKDALQFKAKIITKNLGGTPARDVWVECVSIYHSNSEGNLSRTIKNHILEVRKKPEGYGVILFPNDSYTLTISWEDSNSKTQSSIVFNSGKKEYQIGVTFLVTIAYRIHGYNEIHITHRAYSILNVSLGMETLEGKEINIQPIPFIPGVAD